MASLLPWTEEEERRFLDLLDRSYLEGRNSQYPKLSFPDIAFLMNREAPNNYKFRRVYNQNMLHRHYQCILMRIFRTPAALAEAQLRAAQAASKIAEEAMARSAEADRWLDETTKRLAQAASTNGPMITDIGSSTGLEEAISAARSTREFFVAAAEDAEKAIERAKKAVEDAKEAESPES